MFNVYIEQALTCNQNSSPGNVRQLDYAKHKDISNYLLNQTMNYHHKNLLHLLPPTPHQTAAAAHRGLSPCRGAGWLLPRYAAQAEGYATRTLLLYQKNETHKTFSIRLAPSNDFRIVICSIFKRYHSLINLMLIPDLTSSSSNPSVPFSLIEATFLLLLVAFMSEVANLAMAD